MATILDQLLATSSATPTTRTTAGDDLRMFMESQAMPMATSSSDTRPTKNLMIENDLLQELVEEKKQQEAMQTQEYMDMPMEQPQDAVTSLGQMVQGGQKGIVGAGAAPVTQRFGNRSSVEKYSGGVNLGADLGTAPQTKLAVPPVGEWEVITASPGFNGGSGNLVKARNTQTGEIIGFEHLSQINVRPGQKISGGTIIGLSGGHQTGPGRGNSTGSHSSILYIDSAGNYKDILKSPYSKYLFGG